MEVVFVNLEHKEPLIDDLDEAKHPKPSLKVVLFFLGTGISSGYGGPCCSVTVNQQTKLKA